MAKSKKRLFDYSDLQCTPNDHKRYELIRGELFVDGSRSLMHHRVSMVFGRALAEYFAARGVELTHASTDTKFTRRDDYSPDIVFAEPDGEPSRVGGKLSPMLLELGTERTPQFVVEVTSPAVRGTSRARKCRRYARYGIAHYWVVDGKSRRVKCLKRNGDRYSVVAAFNKTDTLRHADFDGLKLNLAALWNQSSAS